MPSRTRRLAGGAAGRPDRLRFCGWLSPSTAAAGLAGVPRRTGAGRASAQLPQLPHAGAAVRTPSFLAFRQGCSYRQRIELLLASQGITLGAHHGAGHAGTPSWAAWPPAWAMRCCRLALVQAQQPRFGVHWSSACPELARHWRGGHLLGHRPRGAGGRRRCAPGAAAARAGRGPSAAVAEADGAPDGVALVRRSASAEGICRLIGRSGWAGSQGAAVLHGPRPHGRSAHGGGCPPGRRWCGHAQSTVGGAGRPAQAVGGFAQPGLAASSSSCRCWSSAIALQHLVAVALAASAQARAWATRARHGGAGLAPGGGPAIARRAGGHLHVQVDAVQQRPLSLPGSAPPGRACSGKRAGAAQKAAGARVHGAQSAESGPGIPPAARRGRW